MEFIDENHPDKTGYNRLYKDKNSHFETCQTKSAFMDRYEHEQLTPFYAGGHTKGYVRGLAVNALLKSVETRHLDPSEVTILDAGCGQGELSIFLACLGFHVIGVDISEEACRAGIELSKRLEVDDRCIFKAESLECISTNDHSVDFVIGFAALHHFIKYKGVAQEFTRVLHTQGEMFFADGFGENTLFHIFHNKKKMASLGDVILTRTLINNFFQGHKVDIIPTDWFVMIDKLLMKIFSNRSGFFIRRLSAIWFHLDRLVPINRSTLSMSGSVMTHVTIKPCVCEAA